MKMMMMMMNPSFSVIAAVVFAVFSTSVGADTFFRHHPLSQTVPPDSTVDLSCRPDHEWDSPTDTVLWSLDDRMLDDKRGLAIQVNVGTRENGQGVGIYRCHVTTDNGQLTSNGAHVTISYIDDFTEQVVEDSKNQIKVMVRSGNVALVKCRPPKGLPTPVVTYQRIFTNGTVVHINNDRFRVTYAGNLQIYPVGKSDQGVYRCLATNPVTGQRRLSPLTTKLRVAAPVAFIAATFSDPGPQGSQVTVWAGQTNVTLDCVSHGAPIPLVSWQRIDQTSFDDNRLRRIFGNLLFPKVKPSDSGQYMCESNNDRRRRRVSRIVVLNVKDVPRIVYKSPWHIEASISRPLQLEVQLSSSANISWRFNGESVKGEKSIIVNDNKLYVSRLESKHYGYYQAFIDTIDGDSGIISEDSQTWLITSGRVKSQRVKRSETDEVDSSSRVTSTPSSEVTTLVTSDLGRTRDATLIKIRKVIPYSTVKLTCRIPIDMSDNRYIEWYKEGQKVKSETPASNLFTSTVTIERAEYPQDFGLYECMASNKGRVNSKGEAYNDGEVVLKRIQLVEAEALETPDSSVKVVKVPKPRIEHKKNAIRISWKSIKEPIHNLFIEAKQMRKGMKWFVLKNLMADQTSTKIRNSKFNTGVTYKIRYVYVSENGVLHQSKSPQLSIGTSGKKPTSKPTIVQAHGLSETSIFIKYQYSDLNLDGYQITYWKFVDKNKNRKIIKMNSVSRSRTITDLQPNTSYVVFINAFNKYGLSQDSNSVSAKTFETKKSAYHKVITHEEEIIEQKSTTLNPLSSNRRSRTSTSDRLLYIVVGCVMSTMCVVLIILVSMCAWRHRQQKRLDSKHIDQSREAYAVDIQRQKNFGPYMMNGINNQRDDYDSLAAVRPSQKSEAQDTMYIQRDAYINPRSGYMGTNSLRRNHNDSYRPVAAPAPPQRCYDDFQDSSMMQSPIVHPSSQQLLPQANNLLQGNIQQQQPTPQNLGHYREPLMSQNSTDDIPRSAHAHVAPYRTGTANGIVMPLDQEREAANVRDQLIDRWTASAAMAPNLNDLSDDEELESMPCLANGFRDRVHNYPSSDIE